MEDPMKIGHEKAMERGLSFKAAHASVPVVHILDDDPAVRASLVELCNSAGIVACAYQTSEQLLDNVDALHNACIVLDMHLVEETGLNVQQRLAGQGCKMPVIFLTGHGTIPLSVEAMRAGAWEFLTKPVEGRVLIEAVQAALRSDALDLEHRKERALLEQRLKTLTPREREIMPLIISGAMNKVIASRIATTEITVKVHKGRIMTKMAAASLADLVRMAGKLDIEPAADLVLRSPSRQPSGG